MICSSIARPFKFFSHILFCTLLRPLSVPTMSSQLNNCSFLIIYVILRDTIIMRNASSSMVHGNLQVRKTDQKESTFGPGTNNN